MRYVWAFLRFGLSLVTRRHPCRIVTMSEQTKKAGMFSSSKSFQLIKEIFKIFPASDRVKIWVVIAIQIFLSFLDLAGIAVIGVLGALAVTGIESRQPGNRVHAVLKLLHLTGHAFQTQVGILGGIATLLLIARTVFSISLTKRTLLFMSRRSALISAELLTSLFSRSIVDLQRYTQQEILYATTLGVQNLTLGVVGTGVTIISDLSLLLILAAGLLIVDPTIAIFGFGVFSLLGYGLYYFMKRKAFSIGRDEVEYGVKSNQKIIEFLSTYREAIVKNRRESYTQEIAELRYKLADVMAEKNFMPNVSKYMVETTVVLGGLAIGAVQFAFQDATHAVASLSVFLAAGTRIAPAVLRIQQGAIQMRNSLGSSTTTLKMIHEHTGRSNQFDLPVNPDFVYDGFSAEVLIENISFRYPDAEADALSDLSLTVPSGEILAIVGPSGAGKSTLVDLLLGIFPPDKGKVLISGYSPLDTYSKWPGATAYVPQNISITMGSIRENIALGMDPSDFPDDLYWDALNRAQLSSFVRDLPDGLDTFVGDQGTQLSGGQRQRLGIARALFTKPRLLVLDEATSALDVETEAAIASVIQSLSGHTTVITIAHRLSSVRNSNRIVYIDKAKMVAAGSFEDLRSQVPDFDRQADLMGL